MPLRTCNFNAYKLNIDARGSRAWKARVTAVRELAPDLLGVQEIVVDEANTPASSGRLWDAANADL